eukprot:Opistho-2@63188
MAAKIRGMLSAEDLQQKVASGEIETVVVAFTDHYGRLVGKRFDAEFFIEAPRSAACNYLITVDMEMNPVRGYSFANWEKGYGDFVCVADMRSLRLASWLEKSALVLCSVVSETDHKPVAQVPRCVLEAQLGRMEQAGFQAFSASELEYFLYKNSFESAFKNGYSALEPAGYYNEDYQLFQSTRNEPFHGEARRHLKLSGVPVENSKGEAAIGQHELNIKYADMLTMADRHTVYKQCLKELADKQGISVTFMAKPHHDQSGSSCHIHLSLWKDGKNAFAGTNDVGDGIMASDIFLWFLGGWIKHTPEVMLFYAPTINSYKRYIDESWAPTRLAWCKDNRTAGFRIVGAGPSLRIECRIPGADCNIYLAFAASIASGLDGILNKIDPPPMFKGDIYSAQNLPRVPYSLTESADIMASSEWARSAFGSDVVDHYVHHSREEVKAFNRAVTDWERTRYFERI